MWKDQQFFTICLTVGFSLEYCYSDFRNPFFSLFSKGRIPLFGKERLAEILDEYVWSIMESLINPGPVNYPVEQKYG